MKKQFAFSIILIVILSACAAAPSGSGVATPMMITAQVSTVIVSSSGSGTVVPMDTPEPPTAIPTLAGGLSTTELKYKVLEQFPDFFFCDPDFYPIARDDELSLAIQRFAEIQADPELFQAIVAHNGLSATTNFTDEQKLLIYKDYKKLNAIFFQVAGDKYQFQIQTGSESQQGTAITATIDSQGEINILQKQQSFPNCPICLAAGTLIDTPRGAIHVEDLHVGDSVWTMNGSGERVRTIILKTRSVRVPATHQMIHVTLSDGRELWASPGHPTVDGRPLDALKIGDLLDGAKIVALERIHYGSGFTFDILPAGDTGFYWANEILMGSTLSK